MSGLTRDCWYKPLLENIAIAGPPITSGVDAPTVVANRAAPGDPTVPKTPHASSALFPAATYVTTPDADSLLTATDSGSVPSYIE